MKIVINDCYGGFGLSDSAWTQYCQACGWDPQAAYDTDIARDDPLLINLVESMGQSANGQHAELRVVEIPDGVLWQIEEYDGSEWVAEQHRTWS